MNTHDEAIWLVKSGDKILGPFSKKEVAEKLLARELVVIDEVISPRSRWRYVRDEPQFAKVVEEIRRGLMSQREDTEVQAGEETRGSQTETDFLERTPTDFAGTGAAIRVPLEENVVKDAEFVEIPSVAVKPAKPKTVRQYGVQGAEPSGHSKPKQSIVLWIVAGIVIAGIGAFLTMRLGGSGLVATTGGTGAGAEFDKVLASADRAYQFGDLTAAAKAYAQAERLKPGTPEVVLRQAILMITAEGQTVEGKRALENLLTKPTSDAVRTEARIALALADIRGEEYGSAKSRLQALLNDEPGSKKALFDLGIAAFLSKSYDDALKHFEQPRGDEGVGGASTAMAARTLIARGGVSDLQAAVSLLENPPQSAFDFKLENTVLTAYAHLGLGDKKKAQDQVRAALDLDPTLTENHAHDPLLVLSELEWSKFLPLCRELNDKLKSNPSRALYGICLAKAGQAVQARDSLADALMTAREDASLLSANAFVLLSLGRDDEARGVLRLATAKADAPKLAWILAGRECATRSDSACAKEMWSKLEQDEPPVLTALTGLASIAKKEGGPQGEKYLSRVTTVSPRYVPALRLQRQH